MNNFIVGQVTPDMLANIRYGTYIFLGLITTLGALFIAFLVPETKQLSLGTIASPSFVHVYSLGTNHHIVFTEEMDVIFGSEGTAASDYERQAEISREIGLDAALTRLGQGEAVMTGEKAEVKNDMA